MKEKESETGEIVREGLKMSVENESQRLTQGRGRERRETHLDKKGELSQTHILTFHFSVDMCLNNDVEKFVIIRLVAFTDFVQQNVCQVLLFSSSRLCNLNKIPSITVRSSLGSIV